MMLFITKYNEGVNSFGGMVRVKDIEKLLSQSQFLSVSLTNPFIKDVKSNGFGNVVNVVGFLRLFTIFSLLNRASALYFHTVGNFIKVAVFLPFLHRKKWFIDLHGAQPEEFSYLGKPLVAKIFKFFEMLAFSYCDYYIHVSKNMKKHFTARYPRARGLHLYAPILSPNINIDEYIDLDSNRLKARRELGIEPFDTIFLYSGGIQGWQKVDEIVDFTSKTIESGSNVIILSAQKEFFSEALKSYVSNNRLLIKSVSPDLLSTYYSAANYGIMFRDDNTLNIVSSPTKMSEYLYYGMVPLLTSLNVGDFVSLGIDYVQYQGGIINYEYIPSSEKNHKIMCALINQSDFELLREKLNGCC